MDGSIGNCGNSAAKAAPPLTTTRIDDLDSALRELSSQASGVLSDVQAATNSIVGCLPEIESKCGQEGAPAEGSIGRCFDLASRIAESLSEIRSTIARLDSKQG